MEQIEIDELFTNIQIGDYIGWRVDPSDANINNLSSVFTEFGDGEICHIEIVVDKIIDSTNKNKVIDLKVIIANGTNVTYDTVMHRLNPMSLFTLYQIFPIGANDEDRKIMITCATNEVNNKLLYNWDIIKVIAAKEAECKIPIIGFFFNKIVWTTPPADNKVMPGTVCSKSCVNYIRSAFPTFMKKYWIDFISPGSIFDNGEVSIIKY